MLVDNWAISASSTKDDLVYEFLNYMYRKKVIKRMCEEYLFYPPVDVASLEDFSGARMPTVDEINRAQFIVSPASEDQLIDLWVAVKA